ncbi:MAG: hypothetical protein A3B44_02275 [Candidatus Levybacteria bacterium RIFCSPLOWO2_01_FULL_38_21]|nr:MAG: hypothetical protein A3B44_02275 [Candidatus Levybacteria bacterium RIFCSPLOWO2_01_FULL_38_21]
MVSIVMPKISFVILTYNSEIYIEKLINSLSTFFKEDIQKNKIEIIVVDNNSEDQTVVLVKKFVNVKLIENKDNVGFSKGVNLGVSKALSEYIVIINPDTEFRRGDIFDVIEMFEKDRKLGVIGGRIINKNGNNEKSAGRFLKIFEVFLMSLGLDELLGVRNSPKTLKEVDFVSGGFMIVKKDLFEKLSGFDENLFMYIEDMEFCFRVKKEGYRVMFDPRISIFHKSHGSSNRGFAIKNIFKGLLYFQKKHGTLPSYFMVKSMLILKACLLVMTGRIINNKYLIDTYSQALKT